MIDFDHVVVEVPCPGCGYGLEIQLLDARTQVWRWCRCCRARIRMVEPDGSVSGSIAEAEDAIRLLEDKLGRMFR